MNLLAVGTIFSSIVQAIHAAESFFKDSPGKEKFDRVLQIAHGTIDDAVQAFPGIVADVDNLKAAAGPFINAVVTALNNENIFTKDKKPGSQGPGEK